MKRIGLAAVLIALSCALAGGLVLIAAWFAEHPRALIALVPAVLAGPCYGLAGALLRRDAEEAPK